MNHAVRREVSRIPPSQSPGLAGNPQAQSSHGRVEPEVRSTGLFDGGVPVDLVAEALPAEIIFQDARATNDPASLATHEFVDERAYAKAECSTYFLSDGGRRVDSSRTTPQRPTLIPLGAWMLDSLEGYRGHEVSQLRVLDPNDLLVSEDTGPEKRGEVALYREWLCAGMEAPPIIVVETFDRRLKVVDGHRRLAAARAEGAPVLAWVSPLAILSDGTRTGLTREMLADESVEWDKGGACLSLESRTWKGREGMVLALVLHESFGLPVCAVLERPADDGGHQGVVQKTFCLWGGRVVDGEGIRDPETRDEQAACERAFPYESTTLRTVELNPSELAGALIEDPGAKADAMYLIRTNERFLPLHQGVPRRHLLVC